MGEREYVRELNARRAAGEKVPELTSRRIVGGKYYLNDQEVSKEEFDRVGAEAQAEIQRIKSGATPGAEDLDSLSATMKKGRPAVRPSFQDRMKTGLSELDEFKKGGKVKALKSKVSTHQKSKKASSW